MQAKPFVILIGNAILETELPYCGDCLKPLNLSGAASLRYTCEFTCAAQRFTLPKPSSEDSTGPSDN
jgi:hypothetical protein